VLIQEAAYQSMLKRTRQHYHQQIARVLEAQFPETGEARPEHLAYHCTEAGLHAQAVSYWLKAGQHAFQQSAHAEASSHFTRGLEVLKALPDTPERTQQAFVLYLGLARVLTIVKGFAAPEVGAAYARAWELVQQVGETSQYVPVLFGLWQFHMLRSDFQTAYELWEQLFTLTQHQHDTTFLVHAHRALGFTLLCRGEVVRAYRHIQQGLASYNPQYHRQDVLASGQEPGLMCLTQAAQALWMLGYPTQALQRSTEALTLARDLQRPYNLVCTLGWASWLHQHRREWWIAQEQAEAVVALAHEHRFALWGATGTIVWGWALAMQGQAAQGIAQMRQGLAVLEGTGTALMRPYCLAMLAEAYGKAGQAEAGRTVLAEAQAAAQRHGERFHEVELYRLEGELLLACSEEDQAEACFQRALASARSQHAKSLELRTAVSLSRLWQRQGKRRAALQLLEEIYLWFTEGFDTADLRQAKELLAELA
jgi:predicted ATPase